MAALGAVDVAPASAQPSKVRSGACNRFSITPDTVRIDGFIANPASLTGEFRVARKSNKPVEGKPVFELAGDLLSKTGSGPLPKSSVSIGALPDPLSKKVARPVGVTVKDVRFAGEYEGEIRLTNGQCAIPLEVTAAAAPELALVADKPLSLDVVKPSPFNFLNADLASRDSVPVDVVNASQSESRLQAASVALRGDPGGRIPSSGTVAFEDAGDLDDSPLILPASAPARLPNLEIERGDLDPGHYTGAMYLTLSGAEKRVVLPLDIDVKNGPFWAMVAIFFSVLFELGLRLKNRLAPRGAEMAKLRRLKAGLDSADLVFLGPRLKAAEVQALHGETKEAAAEREAIGRDAKDLVKGRVYEEEVRRVKGGQLPHDVSLALQRLRIEASKPGNRGAINTALTELRNLVDDAVRLRGIGLGVREIDSRARFARRSPVTEAIGRVASGARDRIRDLGLRLGITVLPAILTFIFFAAFLLAGLKELYYGDPTFGEDPVLDYGSLFLWGVGASTLRVALGWVAPKDPDAE